MSRPIPPLFSRQTSHIENMPRAAMQPVILAVSTMELPVLTVGSQLRVDWNAAPIQPRSEARQGTCNAPTGSQFYESTLAAVPKSAETAGTHLGARSPTLHPFANDA